MFVLTPSIEKVINIYTKANEFTSSCILHLARGSGSTVCLPNHQGVEYPSERVFCDIDVLNSRQRKQIMGSSYSNGKLTVEKQSRSLDGSTEYSRSEKKAPSKLDVSMHYIDFQKSNW